MIRTNLLISVFIIGSLLSMTCSSVTTPSEPNEHFELPSISPTPDHTPTGFEVAEQKDAPRSSEDPMLVKEEENKTLNATTESEITTAGKYEMRFGINGGMYPDITQGTDAIDAVTKDLDKLGMVWLRHPGKGTTWFEVQPTKDTWDFTKLDAVINQNDHPWVIEIYGANGTVYPFGKDRPIADILEDLVAEGGSEAIYEFVRENSVDMDNEGQKADAEKYVKTFVNRYKDDIKYWEIGNEGIVALGTFEIIKNTYIWIKEVHPDAIVIITAIAGDDEQMFYTHLEAFDSLLAEGICDYFDIANIHYYGRIGDDFEARWEKAYDDYKATMAKYGVDKPIWVTETSASSHANSLLSGPSSEREQARQLVKRLVIFSAKGAKKVFWHDYRDTYADNKFYQCNLVDPDTGAPKPAYYTFKLMVDKLGYYQSVRTLSSGSIRLYEFTKPNHQRVLVAWAESDRSTDLTEFIAADKALITKIVENGNAVPETSICDTRSIQLSASPIFIEPKQ